MSDVWHLHEQACARNADTYVDPDSGFQVFTAVGLRARRRCCGAGCRHCPFEHQSVDLAHRAQRMQQPAWLVPPSDAARLQEGIFWSGGKDSYLTHLSLRPRAPGLFWLTTFDVHSGHIAHQNLAITQIIHQANLLKVPLLGIPLHAGRNYMDHIASALDLAPNCRCLAFGDLHLRHIRDWRETCFAQHERTAAIELQFPLWHRPYTQLLEQLFAAPVRLELSALVHPALAHLQPGSAYDRAFVSALPPQIDALGENGEFHTRVLPLRHLEQGSDA